VECISGTVAGFARPCRAVKPNAAWRRAEGAGLTAEARTEQSSMSPQYAMSSDTVREIKYQILHNISERRFPTGTGVLHQIHFNCSMTVPSEIVGRATPVLLAFLAIHSRAARLLSSAPALSW